MSKEEIELLRAEIIQNYNAIAQYNCVLYTAVTAVLAFAVNSDRYVMCLLPYVVMLPIHFLCETRSGNICRIGAYLYVFSGENFKWESRLRLFDEKRHSTGTSFQRWIKKDTSHLQYYLIAICCSVAAILKIVKAGTSTSFHK